MLKIRLSMGGVRKRPVYKIVIADSRYPRDGKFIEKIGSYNPLLPKDKKERIKVEAERVKYWMSKGAQPTLRVSRILGEAQIMPMPKPESTCSSVREGALFNLEKILSNLFVKFSNIFITPNTYRTSGRTFAD